MRIIQVINKKTKKIERYSSVKIAIQKNEISKKDISRIYYKISRLKTDFENENFIIKRKIILNK